MSDASTILNLPPAPPQLASDPTLCRAKEGLQRIYGERLSAIILYGSRARGDQRRDSDYDLIALIRNYDRERDWKRDLHRLTDELFQMEPYEIEVNIRLMDEHALEQRTGFMFNVRKEGLRL
jgi:predicted nucleotidyltransferase